MTTGWRYRTLSIGGVAGLAAVAVLIANHAIPQYLFTTYIPFFKNLEATVMEGRYLRQVLLLSVTITVGALIPMYKPRPRRILDTVLLTQKRVLVSGLALATLGFFQWSHRLPRATLVMFTGVLIVVLPPWFVAIRRPPNESQNRTILMGDDVSQMRSIRGSIDGELVGYLCPTAALPVEDPRQVIADGGTVDGLEDLNYLGGLSRVEDALVNQDVDTAVLAFKDTDRGEFFGILDACYEHGVATKVHRDYADSLLTADTEVGPLVNVQVEPWDWQDYVLKRGFDLLFAGTALLALSPVILCIVAAIKLEGEGPVLFSQKRTYLFGETFTVYKFRTLKPKKGGEVGTTIEEDRHTPLGQFLRTTHLDEIPQLWSILVGDMSVVGPRPAQTELEGEFETAEPKWRQRWFVKPGLTGLAQINDMMSTEPAEKFRYDLQYIRNQSLWLDVKIVIRQVFKVFIDVAGLFSDD
ncbi:sugar transferase [Halolamina salifodinae]|uniref:Lipopolysaccharide/colanic/teichoic acid biosynthesis glycosyltransferase n=1 Tax=Halolamina salifodinae TaxID=1202767 RepID=A0A8T4GZD8_9EURY|nr:sugar transferase [Halolamina salifodinae]MBP1987790.1 lipopolysaccharide/colanic/teichoic acid biosynthesis glycosyltransferase [Halolamina salifodinae]